jgi:glycosyltransferase involved in cell wall biosynthesis
MDLINKNKIGIRRYKIAVVHPGLGQGGSEARALWLISALKNDYDVSLITANKVDIQQLNRYYGTSLDPKEFKIIKAPLPFWLNKSKKFAALKGRFIQRYCQNLSFNFDIMISAYNPINFKKRSIQFIADFSFDEESRQNNFLRKIYLRICDWISPINIESWKKDVVIANSDWTKNLMRQKYNVSAEIIYPPVMSNFSDVSYKKRENGFVCIGRIAPEKRIDEIIKILERVREDGYNIRLHIAGEINNDEYSKGLKNICLKNKEWIFLEGKLNEKEKKELIVKNLFGISARKEEAFGIAVAEMVKGGCIVFVPNSGGQTEIVNDSRLIFKDIDDAVVKIEKVLSDKELQNQLNNKISINSQKFSIDNFKMSVKELINEFLKKNRKYMQNKYKLTIVAPTPFYYHVPLYQRLNQSPGIDLTVFFCSKEALRGVDIKKMYNTKGRIVGKETLLEGYNHKFLRNYSLNPSYMRWPFGLINLGIWSEIRRGKYDMVILQSWSNITWWLAFVACLISKTPVFFMTDANILSNPSKAAWRRLAKKILLGKLLFKEASGFLTAGEANEQFYKYYGVSQDKMVRLHFSWGYEWLLEVARGDGSLRGAIRRAYGIQENDFVILSVARLSKEKAPLDLLNAYSRVSFKNKKLFFVGDGPMRGELERGIKTLDRKNIFITGFQDREKIPNFYLMADLFVLSSKDETWGIVINEAMCFGLPIIASSGVAAAVELIRNGYNGFIYEVGDIGQLSRRIEQIIKLRPEERILFGKRSKDKIYHWVHEIDPAVQIIKVIELSSKNKKNEQKYNKKNFV